MKTSCISHPEKESLLLIRAWQIKFCDGNACAAALLSYFEYWHAIKLEMTAKNRKSNDIAETHGDERTQDESLLQFHSHNELIEGILGVYGKGAVIAANKLLEEKGAISIHRNPNPRYSFDKTNYYLFHPEVCNAWLVNYKNKCTNNEQTGEASLNNKTCEDETIEDRFQTIDSPKPDYRSSEIGQRSSENGQAITEITNRSFKRQIDKKSVNKILGDEVILAHQTPIAEMQGFLFTQAGISLAQLSKPDSQQALASMVSQGITLTHIEQALARAVQCKPDETFGLYYLKKIAESLLSKEQSFRAKRRVASKRAEFSPTKPAITFTDEQIEKMKQVYIEKNNRFTALSRELIACQSAQEKSKLFDEKNKLSMWLGKLESEFKQLQIKI